MSEINTTRAVILGGGGVVGLAWEIGVLAGFKEAGIDLIDHADALIGTSAGSFAAVLVASGADLEERYQAQFEPPENEVSAAMDPKIQQKYQDAFAATYGQAIPLAKAFGEIARTAKTISTDVRTSVVETRLGISEWPDSDLLYMTAIDADTGEIVLLDKNSGLSLVEAASATGAVPGVWPMVVAGGRNWIDGGMISAVNTELGAGYDRVLVIAPLAGGNGGFDDVDAAAEKLRSSAAVVTITLDDVAKEAIGTNFLNPDFRALAAEAGRTHALRVAEEVRATWIN